MKQKELLEVLKDELKTEALKSLLKKQFLSNRSMIEKDGVDLSIDWHLDFIVDNYIMMQTDPVKAMNDSLEFAEKVQKGNN